MDLPPMTTSYCRHSPSLSREENVLHAFLFLAFLFLRFRKVEEVQHIIVIPSDSHSGINYPPTFVGPPFLSRKELHTACFPFAKLLYVYLFIRDHSTFPCNPHGGTRPLSVSSSSILSFIQTYSILLSTIRQQRPGCQ